MHFKKIAILTLILFTQFVIIKAEVIDTINIPERIKNHSNNIGRNDDIIALFVEKSNSDMEHFDEFNLLLKNTDSRGNVVLEKQYSYYCTKSRYSSNYGIHEATCDIQGNIYVFGYFTGIIEIFGDLLKSEPCRVSLQFDIFERDKVTTNTLKIYNGFVAKLDSLGNPLWVVKTTGPKRDYCWDDDGNLCLLNGYRSRWTYMSGQRDDEKYISSALKINSDGKIISSYFPGDVSFFKEYFYTWSKSGKLYIIGLQGAPSKYNELLLATRVNTELHFQKLNISAIRGSKIITCAFLDSSENPVFTLYSRDFFRLGEYSKKDTLIINGEKIFQDSPITFKYNIRSDSLDFDLNKSNGRRTSVIERTGNFVIKESISDTVRISYKNLSSPMFRIFHNDFWRKREKGNEREFLIEDIDNNEVARFRTKGYFEVQFVRPLDEGYLILGQMGNTLRINGHMVIKNEQQKSNWIEILVDRDNNIYHLAFMDFRPSIYPGYFNKYLEDIFLNNSDHIIYYMIENDKSDNETDSKKEVLNIYKYGIPSNPEGNFIK